MNFDEYFDECLFSCALSRLYSRVEDQAATPDILNVGFQKSRVPPFNINILKS